MIFSLVGMSGCGKTYWSKKLELFGFKRFCCDDFIEHKLGNELKKIGYLGIQDVAKWLGLPFEPQHKKNSELYLKLEHEAVEKVLSQIEKMGINNSNIIIDTTGSIIYLENRLLKKLASITHVVYIEISKEAMEALYMQFLADPKPIIWNGSFNRYHGESNLDALKRCYPQLLKYRSKKYEQIAKVKIDYLQLRKNNLEADKFMQLVKSKL